MKERLMVKQLDDFLKHDETYPVAILSGLRKIGKTTILKQLESKYTKSFYIDCSFQPVKSISFIIDALNNQDVELLLIDEYTNIGEFEELAVKIYDVLATQTKLKRKCIITGSSPVHLNRLNHSRLGGGRSKLFKLPPITFVEYCYFTGKIQSYQDLSNVKNDYFIDYLKRTDLPNGLLLDFDKFYLRDAEDIILLSNENARLYSSDVNIKTGDLQIMRNLISYKISDLVNYNTLLHPKIGYQEFRFLRDLEHTPSFESVNLNDTLIKKSSNNVIDIEFKDRIRIINFMLEAGIALVVRKDDGTDDVPTYDDIIKTIKTAKKYKQFEDIDKYFSIQLISTHWYMYLCEDIFKKFNYSLDVLAEGEIVGKLVELYLGGTLYYKSIYNFYMYDKLTYSGEVDIFDKENNILIESTISDKKLSDINIKNYDENLLKICSTKSIEDSQYGFFRIPYAKLLCMLDTGYIFNYFREDLIHA